MRQPQVDLADPSLASGRLHHRGEGGASVLLSTIRRAMVLVWHSSPRYTVVNFGVIVFDAGLPLLLLLGFKRIIDATTTAATSSNPRLSEVLPALVFTLVVALAMSALRTASRLAKQAQSIAVTDHMLGLMQEQAATIDFRYLEDTDFRNLLHRAHREAPNRPARMFESLLSVAQGVVSSAVMAGLLVSLSWLLVPIALWALLPAAIVRLGFARQLHALAITQSEATRRAAYYESLNLSPDNAQEVRLLGVARRFGALAKTLRLRLRTERFQLSRRRLMRETVADGFATLAMFGVVMLLIHSTLSAALTVGGLVMYLTAVQRGWMSFGLVIQGVADIREHSLFLDDVFRFLDIRPVVSVPKVAVAVPNPVVRGFDIERVSFRYPGSERDALQDISCRIDAGEHVAIVGRNGSGKSTLVKLLCRFYDPTAGRILLDGADLRQFDPTALRGLFSVHVQNFARFQETVRENITLGDINRSVSDDELEAAVHLAGVDSFSQTLPQGLETMLGRTFRFGHELSGGQWQRISLARTLVRKAPVLVLDEPTASLDIETSLALVGRLLAFARGRTAIIISHRISAAMNLDRILVLDEGRLVEQGSHAELLARGGRYAQLFHLEQQAMATSPRTYHRTSSA